MGNKQTIFSFMMILMLVVFMPMSLAFTGTGAGTLGDPYVMTTPAQLDEMHIDLEAHYVLGNDIDMAGITTFEPVGNWSSNLYCGATAGGYCAFQGSFDGNNFTISNLLINYTDPTQEKPNGLFGVVYLPTHMRNVFMDNVTVTSPTDYQNHCCSAIFVGADDSDVGFTYSNIHITNSQVLEPLGGENGGVVGYGEAGTGFYNVSFQGDVYGNRYIGGIVGAPDQSTFFNHVSFIGNLYFNQSFGSSSSVGGLMGNIKGANNILVNNSYVKANITVISSEPIISVGDVFIGGIFGRTAGVGNENMTIENTYVQATLIPTSYGETVNYIGRIDSIGSCTNVYYDFEIETDVTLDNFASIWECAGSTGLTTAQMNQEASYTGFDFTNVWQISEGVSTPTHVGVGVIACASDFVCTGYGTPVCLENNTNTASCNAVIDNNVCGIPYAGNYSEFAPQINSCSYITVKTNDAQNLVFALLPLILIIGLLFSMPTVRQGAINKLQTSGTTRMVVGVFALIITVTLLTLL